jgi:PucR family transcriptional regulator, purine catabolism regulatory protein
LQQLFGRGGMQAVLSELAQLASAEVVIADKADAPVAQSGGLLGRMGHEAAFPIRIGGKTLGQLVLRTVAAELNPLHAIYARQAAEICGIEMLQRLTRQETEERLGLDLVEQLLDESQAGEDIVARFRRMGYDLSPQRRHVAVALGSAVEGNQYAACSDTARDLQWLSQREGASVISTNYHRHFLVFASFSESISERTIRAWLQEVLSSASAQRCSAGASRAVLIAEPPSASGIGALREIVHQALDAWDLGQRISGRVSPYYYEELGLYRLLANLRSQEEMQRFYQETLGALADYDAAHNAELVRTLEVFFRENTNASQTARALFVHRNTLNYRLQRIVEITGLDLDDAESRLALQVAVKIHHLTH